MTMIGPTRPTTSSKTWSRCVSPPRRCTRRSSWRTSSIFSSRRATWSHAYQTSRLPSHPGSSSASGSSRRRRARRAPGAGDERTLRPSEGHPWPRRRWCWTSRTPAKSPTCARAASPPAPPLRATTTCSSSCSRGRGGPAGGHRRPRRSRSAAAPPTRSARRPATAPGSAPRRASCASTGTAGSLPTARCAREAEAAVPPRRARRALAA
mmetsp:Transcript_35843/g.100835  ORF Transcript_35843/g.100835 Transcript_35843/m.100835 type:complete len:209 (+) Transcript_35843:802-1428(+)